MTVFPRLEAVAATLEPRWLEPESPVAFGVSGLDAMLSGGVTQGSSTLLLGTPGAGKSILGLHFLAEGARQGEPGVLVAFHETAPVMASTGDRIGLNLSTHMAAGMIHVLWHPPLERSPDEWVWQLLAAVDAHQPERLVIDAFSDLANLFPTPGRQSRFAAALSNELRNRGVTTLFILEHDSFTGPELAPPIPRVSATMDNGILLRTVELQGTMRRMVSILKLRQSAFDPAIREFTIGKEGMMVGDSMAAIGSAVALSVTNPA